MPVESTSTRAHVLSRLEQLVGLSLSATLRAADMRVLKFGALRPVDGGEMGDFGLHFQCPWRIEGPDGIVTGRSDLWEPIERGPDFDWDTWRYDKSPNVQDSEMEQWMSQQGRGLVVASTDADEYGGAAIHFGDGFTLRLFPAGTRGEDWRLLSYKDAPHFVVAGGKVEL